jgi:hypothetical protein
LRVGIDSDELDPFEADLDHSVDSVNTAAANTNNFDNCQVILWSRHGRSPYPFMSMKVDPSNFSATNPQPLPEAKQMVRLWPGGP